MRRITQVDGRFVARMLVEDLAVRVPLQVLIGTTRAAFVCQRAR